MNGWHRPVSAPLGKGFNAAGGMWSSGHHTGQDFECPAHTMVTACADGRVTFAGRTFGTYAGGYGWAGNMVKVSHGHGLETWYCHLSSVMVSPGDRVVGGSTIVGFSGATGNVTGPHLHLEVRRDGVAVDPMPYLNGKAGPTPKPHAAYPGQGAPYPATPWDGSTKAQAAGLGLPSPGDVLTEARDLTLTGLAVSAGFGLVALGALVAAWPRVKKTAGDAKDAAIDAAELAAAPETGGASLEMGEAAKGAAATKTATKTTKTPTKGPTP